MREIASVELSLLSSLTKAQPLAIITLQQQITKCDRILFNVHADEAVNSCEQHCQIRSSSFRRSAAPAIQASTEGGK